eukprot:CAMPEP_0171164140 /NCGR_PEP_ID=MMETSP0790-20130122/5515_1 /TAXON_ID=2925 /ORGANISM="Alexandrium catenella, Strain OF101" /LENGTH=209 /DNA_ID=CAMNT_0011628887 /DNA_START=148 /DNA_END=775 /DNA_ORIENTATION=-
MSLIWDSIASPLHDEVELSIPRDGFIESLLLLTDAVDLDDHVAGSDHAVRMISVPLRNEAFQLHLQDPQSASPGGGARVQAELVQQRGLNYLDCDRGALGGLVLFANVLARALLDEGGLPPATFTSEDCGGSCSSSKAVSGKPRAFLSFPPSSVLVEAEASTAVQHQANTMVDLPYAQDDQCAGWAAATNNYLTSGASWLCFDKPVSAL